MEKILLLLWIIFYPLSLNIIYYLQGRIGNAPFDWINYKTQDMFHLCIYIAGIIYILI